MLNCPSVFKKKEPKGTKILIDKDTYFREKTGEIMNIN
jgi:hypothetical protein